MLAPTLDATGSAINAQHAIPVGTPVIVTKYGAVQWADLNVVVHRHDRNGTYLLRFDNDTFVTAHADEVEVKPMP